LLGQWIEQRGVRKDILLHSKTGMLPGDNTYSEGGVAEALEKSLERLRTDYLDLYYVHADNEELPVAQIVASFDATTKNGSVRSLGASNFRFERLREAREYADETGAMPFTVLQNHYNLLEREAYGEDLQNHCEANSVAMCPYFGLASGYLTGKYRSMLDLAKSIRGVRTKAYLKKGPPVLSVMDEIAKETGASLPAIALAWLRVQRGIAAPIASARNSSQLAALIESTTLQLDEDQVSRLTKSI
jgi:aryl-alcohol dehydrogenase-like predicted oxidoreductase